MKAQTVPLAGADIEFEITIVGLSRKKSRTRRSYADYAPPEIAVIEIDGEMNIRKSTRGPLTGDIRYLMIAASGVYGTDTDAMAALEGRSLAGFSTISPDESPPLAPPKSLPPSRSGVAPLRKGPECYQPVCPRQNS